MMMWSCSTHLLCIKYLRDHRVSLSNNVQCFETIFPYIFPVVFLVSGDRVNLILDIPS